MARAEWSVFISRDDGRYQVPDGILCDRSEVPDGAEAKFVGAMESYLCREGREDVPPFLSDELNEP